MQRKDMLMVLWSRQSNSVPVIQEWGKGNVHK